MSWCTAHYSSSLTQAVELPPFCDMKLNVCVLTSRLISGYHSKLEAEPVASSLPHRVILQDPCSAI